MPQTITQINADIDAAIKDSPPKNIKASVLRGILKQVTTFLDDLVTGRVSPWFKVGAGTPSLNVTDDVYRTGKVIVGRTYADATSAALQTDSFSIAGVPFSNSPYMYGTDTSDFDNLTAIGAYSIGGSTWLAGGHGPGTVFPYAFTYGTLLVSRAGAGNVIQTYIDNNDGSIFTRQKWQTNAWGTWYWSKQTADFTITNMLKFPDTLANRRIALYGAATNDHNYYGFGINNATLRYQVGDPSSSHVFYTGTSPTTSYELFRIAGSGNVGAAGALGAGVTIPGYQLDVRGNGGILASIQANSGYAANGLYQQFHMQGVTVWKMGVPPNTDAFCIYGWNGGASPEFLRINGSGNVGINQNNPAGKLDIVHVGGTNIGLKVSNGTTLQESYIGFTDGKNYFRNTTVMADTNSADMVGIGTATPTSKLQVKGTAGHNQFRLENAYTPTSSSDGNGQIGQIAWDTNYLYLKTSAGWKRTAALATF